MSSIMDREALSAARSRRWRERVKVKADTDASIVDALAALAPPVAGKAVYVPWGDVLRHAHVGLRGRGYKRAQAAKLLMGRLHGTDVETARTASALAPRTSEDSCSRAAPGAN